MTISFYWGVAILVIAAGTLVLVLPRWWRRDLRGESALDWLRLRRTELEGDMAADAGELLTDAELRVLEELDANGEEALAVTPGSNQWPLLLVLVLLAVLPLVLYRELGALEDVRITEALDTVAERPPEAVPQLISAIEQRVSQRPENSDYLSLLGQYYTSQEQHQQALGVYRQLLELFPESPEVLARAAQADYLAADRTLSPTAKRWAQAALAADPDQRTALGTLGMAAFEAGNYAEALGHWQRLIAFETPGTPGYQMMASVIAEARERGDIPEPATAPEGVTVAVTLPSDQPAPAEGMVFVIARPAGSAQRMPTAVVRRPASELPITVRLDDAAAMTGQQVSSLAAVDIEVQLNPSGQPGKTEDSWVASAANVVPSADAVIELVLRAP